LGQVPRVPMCWQGGVPLIGRMSLGRIPSRREVTPMIRQRRIPLPRRQALAGMALAALGAAACAPAMFQAPQPTTGTKAAGLRAVLNTLLQEHVYLAAVATSAALGGREAEFKAAAEALDGNSVDFARTIGSIYGAETERTFLDSWRSHIAMFVDYTVSVVAQDKAKQDKAVKDLLQYAQDFGGFLSRAAGLPKETATELVKTHILTLKEVVDAQAAKDPLKAFAALRKAAGHMKMLADPLAEAIVKKFPERFS